MSIQQDEPFVSIKTLCRSLRLTILQRYQGKGLWVNPRELLLARGSSLWRIEQDGHVTRRAMLHQGFPEQIACRWRVARQALRVGLHNLVALNDGTLIGIAKGRMLRLENGATSFETVQAIRHGNKPGFNGVCVDKREQIYFGEYSLNRERLLPVGLFRSVDRGSTYELIFEFPPAQVRHIHFIQYDPHGDALWMGTGDRNAECRLLRSTDNGASWETVGEGSQLWRAVALAFTREAIFWGTDAGQDAGATPNYIVRLPRATHEPELVQEIQGPCHGITALANGTLVAATGIEGGRNEMDGRAHLWASRDGEQWDALASWPKDGWPLRVQFGVIHFTHNQQNGNQLVFTTLGLRSGGETCHVASIEEAQG